MPEPTSAWDPAKSLLGQGGYGDGGVGGGIQNQIRRIPVGGSTRGTAPRDALPSTTPLPPIVSVYAIDNVAPDTTVTVSMSEAGLWGVMAQAYFTVVQDGVTSPSTDFSLGSGGILVNLASVTSLSDSDHVTVGPTGAAAEPTIRLLASGFFEWDGTGSADIDASFYVTGDVELPGAGTANVTLTAYLIQGAP